MIRRLVGRGLRACGYEAVRTTQLSTFGKLGHLMNLKHVLERLNVDCVFDVGANKGQFRDLLRQEARYEGRVISFEPLPHLIEVLQRRARDDGSWAIAPYALGAADGTLWLHVTTNDDLSSFLPPRPDPDVPWSARCASVVDRAQLPVKRLGSVYGELRTRYRFDRPFLKMDTQGYEVEVLRGAADVLSEFVGIQCELAVRPLYENAPLYRDVIELLGAKGFSLAGLYPIAVDDRLRLVEMDGIFVNAGETV